MSCCEYDDDVDVDTIATDTDTEHTRESSSLVKDLQLSQLCRAKLAVALNTIHHVQMCGTHEGEEDATVYVLDVFLQSTPRGITKKSNRIMDVRSPDFQVKHRYSAFRALREQIGEAVKVPKDKSHAQWCPYCSRVRELVHSRTFPSRFPNCGNVMITTGLHNYLVHNRKQRLGSFMNLLLRAAKDISYRSGCTPCQRFELVSKLLSDFLAEPPSSVSDVEDASVEYDMRSTRSMSSSFYFPCSARTDHLGGDPGDISMRSYRQVDPICNAKNDQKKLRKTVKRAVKQERKEARKMTKLARKADKSLRKQGSSSNRIAHLSAGTASNCSVTSDQEILAEIWAMPSSTDEVMPAVDDESADSQPMEFLFFTGCPDDKNLRE
ncbi:Hypothetical protein PHPALM_18742, partial [Phytophthora palmivora]